MPIRSERPLFSERIGFLFSARFGSTFTYGGKTFVSEPADDGATHVIALDPYVFHKGNPADRVDVL